MELRWEQQKFCMKFLNETFGSGRKVRSTVVPDCTNLRIIADRSSIEVYLNDGGQVLGSRMYPEKEDVGVTVQGIAAECFTLREMNMEY